MKYINGDSNLCAKLKLKHLTVKRFSVSLKFPFFADDYFSSDFKHELKIQKCDLVYFIVMEFHHYINN